MGFDNLQCFFLMQGLITGGSADGFREALKIVSVVGLAFAGDEGSVVVGLELCEQQLMAVVDDAPFRVTVTVAVNEVETLVEGEVFDWFYSYHIRLVRLWRKLNDDDITLGYSDRGGDLSGVFVAAVAATAADVRVAVA